MTARPGDRRCPTCKRPAELHEMTGFDDCDTPASLIPVTVNLPDTPLRYDGENWFRDTPVSEAYDLYLRGRLTRVQYDAIVQASLASAVLTPDAPLDALSSGARHTDEEGLR